MSFTDSRTVLFIYLQIQETKARLILFPVIFSLCIIHFNFSVLLSSPFSFLSVLLFYTSYYCPCRINSVINIFPEFASPTHQNPSALSHRLFVFFSSISSQTLTKEQKFNINHRKIKKYEKMEMVSDKLPRYQEFEQVLGNITPVNKFFETQKQIFFACFLQTYINECIIERSFLFVPVFHIRKLRARFP